MSDLSHTPIDVPILPRNREHDIALSLGRDWFDNHSFKTAWFNAMSITFPLGEKFFIDSVRYFADRIDDLKLNEDIRGFCGQEGFHRREHQRYNESLCQQRGYDLQVMEGRLEKNIQRGNKFLSPLERLAATAALEHITAIMAESALSDDDPMIGQADSAMQKLWQWHAAEEMEHKSVAFDVYRAVGGSESLRISVMKRASFFIGLELMRALLYILRKDGQLFNVKLWHSGIMGLFGKQGAFSGGLAPYKEFYAEGFHPWQQDTRQLLVGWAAEATPQAS